MNWDMVEGQWKQFKGNAKETWGKLTDDDLTSAEGKRDRLIGRLQERYGYERERAEKEVEAWSRKLHVRYEDAGPQPGS
jgi:uncharacterized protein YjbJ (UPF0337 family)